ncbi:MAG: XdhC family protein [bacterium]|nr:XdhC family protein [bacterium]
MKEIYEELLKIESSGGTAVLVTVVAKEGSGPGIVGRKLLVLPDGSMKGTVGGGAIEFVALKRSKEILENHESRMVKYLLSPDNDVFEGEKTGMTCGGTATLYYEYIGPGARIYIFGAGHVGQALVRHLRHLDYYVTVIDKREEWIDAMEGAQRNVLVKTYDTVLEGETVPPGSYFIITTHGHAFDFKCLKRIYQCQWNPEYIGLIASRKKAPMVLNRITKELGNDIDLNVLHTPMGLAIGGSSPDEIAISIIAEIQAIRYNKEGFKHMRIMLD